MDEENEATGATESVEEADMTPESGEAVEIAEEATEAPQDGVPLTDDRSQHQIDMRLLYMSLQQAREELAVAKLQYHLVAAGIKGGPHGNQAKASVEEKQFQLDTLLTLIGHVEKSGTGIPKPSRLEVAVEIP